VNHWLGETNKAVEMLQWFPGINCFLRVIHHRSNLK
jgi:hypothetical protein